MLSVGLDNNPSRNANCSCSRRYIRKAYCVCAYFRPISNMDRANCYSASANRHILADNRTSGRIPLASPARNRYVLADNGSLANHGFFMHNHAQSIVH